MKISRGLLVIGETLSLFILCSGCATQNRMAMIPAGPSVVPVGSHIPAGPSVVPVGGRH